VTPEARQSRLCLAISAAERADALGAALAAADIAAVVIRSDTGEPPSPALVRPLTDLIQAKGAAALLLGDARVARTVHADGVHLPPSKTLIADYQEAREILGARAIVGADAGRSRHDAMTLGETGADYVAFGVPDFVAEREHVIERQRELIGWWADIFEVPVVAFDVTSTEWAARMAAAGADFVSLRLPPESGTQAAGSLVESAAAALTTAASELGTAN
jgi:thiamine-phosphate pyrophosphorylase